MLKERLFSEIKNEMSHVINEMVYSERATKLDDIKSYIKFIEALESLPEISSTIKVAAEEEVSNNFPVKEEMEKLFKEALLVEKEDTAENTGEVFVFERKVRGGVVLGLDNGANYVIPEKMVRDIGLNHLDKVRILDKAMVQDYRNPTGQKRAHYKLEIAEKSNAELTTRIEYRFCIVREKMEFGMYVEMSNGEPIRVNGTKIRLYLSEADIKQFNIEDGDIIDVAFYSNNPEGSVRIIHKEEFSNYDMNRINLVNKTPIKRKPVSEKPVVKVEKDYGINDKTLYEGKSLLVVGGGSRHPDFKKAIESLEAEFIGADGDEQRERLERMVKSSDAMVISIGEISHAASTAAVEFAKKYKVPYSVSAVNGVQSVVRGFEEAFNKRVKEEVTY